MRPLAEPYHTSPEHLTDAALRQDCLSLKHVQHASSSTRTMALCGITFCADQTRHQAWPTRTFVRPPQARTLPALLSMEAVHTIRQGVRFPRSRGWRSTLYACGLRLPEGPHWQVPETESARLVGPVRGGTGAHARAGPLPPPRLALLRPYWTTYRHPGWLLPAPGRSGLGMATASTPRPRHSVQDAWRAALHASAMSKRASVPT